MKIDRHGKAKILTQTEIQLLFSQGLETDRSRALFGICLYCCCRINEACTLSVNDVYDRAGRARAELIIRKGNTKGKLATRAIPVIEDLRVLLKAYQFPIERGYLFPGHLLILLSIGSLGDRFHLPLLPEIDYWKLELARLQRKKCDRVAIILSIRSTNCFCV